MPDLQLYTLVVPSASQSQLGNLQRQELAQLGVLNQDGGITEQLSSNPADQTLNGVYRGQYAEKMATEVDELSSASGFEAVPLAGMGASAPLDGYYAVEEANVEPAQAQTGRAQRYELSLSKKGTKNDHWRALETNPNEDIDHEFGNDTSLLVGVPAAAEKVQWLNDDDWTRTPASAAATRSAELGDVDIYDLDGGETAAGTSNPTLLYEIGYTDEEDVDTRVYDTLGNAAKLDVDGNLQWQKVFSTTHDFDAEVILDTGLLRLRLDEPNGTLEAEEWDAGTGSWTTVGLEADQPVTIDLMDVDLMDVAMVRDRAQLTFDVGGKLFALNAIVTRGADTVQFTIPEGETGPIDPDLEDWLEPIASTSAVDPQPSKGLVSRREVRR
ncbi:hypothetical protein HYG81_15125 [Natrinema zhouii]|uniref:Uncharacterized protein n=1 Tax=Natrinema zhouii TaxID=1710539 RepID=A0A7D6GZ01_9EURY|nr:hypothetical protein [Natrinema zhouii]QLK25405.1 hypothetical protein HYG81_15125 [Natrinema zhouii]